MSAKLMLYLLPLTTPEPSLLPEVVTVTETEILFAFLIPAGD